VDFAFRNNLWYLHPFQTAAVSTGRVRHVRAFG
jgi:hypothetical protein